MQDERDSGAGEVARSEAAGRRGARDDVLVEMLAAGHSYGEAAGVAGCSARTVARRMGDEAFRDRVALRRGELVAEITGTLADLGRVAVGVLRAALVDEELSVQLRAVQMTLTHLGRFNQQTELERLSRQVLARLDDGIEGMDR